MGSVDRKHGHIFEAVPGDFMQDDTKTDPETFDYVRRSQSHSPLVGDFH